MHASRAFAPHLTSPQQLTPGVVDLQLMHQQASMANMQNQYSHQQQQQQQQQQQHHANQMQQNAMAQAAYQSQQQMQQQQMFHAQQQQQQHSQFPQGELHPQQQTFLSSAPVWPSPFAVVPMSTSPYLEGGVAYPHQGNGAGSHELKEQLFMPPAAMMQHQQANGFQMSQPMQPMHFHHMMQTPGPQPQPPTLLPLPSASYPQMMAQHLASAASASSVPSSHMNVAMPVAHPQQDHQHLLQQHRLSEQIAAAEQAIAAASSMTLEEKSARLAALMRDGDMLRSRHMYAEAIQRYNSILLLFGSPSDPNAHLFKDHLVQALNFKGTCHKSLKDVPAATECYQRALALAPNEWVSHNNLGVLSKENEQFDAAVEHYAAAIRNGPPNNVASENMSVVKTDLGTRFKLSGDVNQAIACYLQAIEYNAAYWPAHFCLGVVEAERGDFDAALHYYERAVEKNPNYCEALCNIGVLKKTAGQLQAAIDYYQRALKSNPNFVTAANNLAIAKTDLGTQLKNEGKLDEAIAAYKQALFQNSKYPAAWYNLGVAESERNNSDESKLCYELAVMFDPRCAEAHNNLGVIHKDRGNLEQAVHHYSLALSASPSFAQSLNNCAVIYTMLGKLDEAHEYCSRAIRASPTYAEAHNNMGVLLRDEGRIDDAIASYEACLKIDPHSRNAGQNRLLALNSVCRPKEPFADTMEKIYQAHLEWGRNFAQHLPAEKFTHWANTKFLSRTLAGRLPTRPLKIGYISADFFTHSVSYFIEAPLKYADPSRTFVTCYANVARRDKKTQLLQGYAHAWRAIHDKNAMEVCEMVRADGIDILVELTGHTAGNRLDVMALKPAPVQATWIGYANCFPEDDHQLLTADGFLFLHEIEAKLAAHGSISVACYRESGSLEYRDVRAKELIVNDSQREPTHPPHRLIDINSATSSDGNATHRVSLSPTANHRMYTRLHTSAKRDVTAPFRIHTAGNMLEAGVQDPSTVAQFIGYAAHGVDRDSSFDWRSIPCVQPLQLGSEEQFHAFLEDYGCWMASGVVSTDADPLCASFLRKQSRNSIPRWMLESLNATQLRRVIRGLSSAHSSHSDERCLIASTPHFRDDLTQLLLHAGYATHHTISPNEAGERTWKVCFSDSSTLSTMPEMVVAESCVEREWHGKVWCVSVPTREQLIVFRRVLHRDEDGTVLAASQPIVVGNTTGLSEIDYRFVDEVVDPLHTKQKYSETLVRLPGPFLCYSPPADAPAVLVTPALHRGYVTFGSYNNLSKINDQVLDAWCTILNSIPTSRMIVKCKPFASSSVVTKMLQRFADRGVEATRIDLMPLLPTTSEHLATYAAVDISVDTFPYAGTTTTCEALYCGVPVVTYQRVDHPCHAHNVGASLLCRIPGGEKLIAQSIQQYVSIAIGLASDLPRLQQLRQHLRPAMLQSDLCNGPKFVENLTQTYHALYEHWCNNSSSDSDAASSVGEHRP